MASKSLYKARIAKRRKRLRQAGDVSDLRRKLWAAVEEASGIVGDEDAKPELRLRAVHGITQASGAYMKLLEASEFEARLKALEERMESGAGRML